jgi:hypothetical protein
MHHSEMRKRYTILCETEVFASGGYGRENVLTKCLVALIFRKIEFCSIISFNYCSMESLNLRLKHVCELGSLSLLP